MKNIESLTWDNFVRSVIEVGAGIHEFCNKPHVAIEYSKKNDLFVFTAQHNGELIDFNESYQMDRIKFRSFQDGDQRYVKMFLTDFAFLEQFYHLSSQMAFHLAQKGLSVTESFEKVLKNWDMMVKENASAIAQQQEIGLWAELHLLETLFDVFGDKCLDMWTGPSLDSHDFRFLNTEIEVKATMSSQLKCTIHGLNQLAPSSGYKLCLLIYPLIKDGDGFSIFDIIDQLGRKFSKSVKKKDIFEGLVSNVLGTKIIDRSKVKKYKLRSEPSLIFVDSRLPALTGESLKRISGDSALPRLADINYTIDCQNLNDLGTQTVQEFLKGLKNV